MRSALLASVAALALLLPAGSAAAAPGELTHLADPFGCHSAFNLGPDCSSATVLNGAQSVEISRNGRFVYVGGRRNVAPDRGIAIFSRDTTTGRLTQLPSPDGCITDDGTGGSCKVGAGVPVQGIPHIALSPDGRNLYATSFDAGAIYSFARDATTGVLTQLHAQGAPGCISAAPILNCLASPATAKLAQINDLRVSPDGRNLYATTLNGPLLTFDRNPQTGGLSFRSGAGACISDTGAGPCADGRGLASQRAIEVAPSGDHVYVSANDSVAILDRDPLSGKLTQAQDRTGCISLIGTECLNVAGLDGPVALDISSDGRFLYSADFTDKNLTSFAIGPSNGHLTQLGPEDGCLQSADVGLISDGCRVALFPGGTIADVEVSPEGRSLYLISALRKSILSLARNPVTGVVNQLADSAGCVSDPVAAEVDCAVAEGLDHLGGGDLELSHDGASLYQASEIDGAVASFSRAPVAPVAPLRCRGLVASVLGTPVRDVIRGTAAADVVVALGGDDLVLGLGGKDTLCGGGGDDSLFGGGGRDFLIGRGGKDTLRGGPRKDVLQGGSGRDLLIGGPGRDVLRGGPGVDVEKP